VTPLGEKGQEKEERENRFYLVLFEDAAPPLTPSAEAASPHKTKSGAADRKEVKRLKEELANTQDAFRASIESEDSIREEFQSANEEILSTNEELQSTNEELETSKEELQSTNEELNTLNAELRSKNTELQDLGNDISNLLNSTRIPVVMLDPRLCIRRITPAANRIVKATASDIGRPLGDIKINIEPSDLSPRELEQMIAKVLDSLQPFEREVRDLDNCWHRLTVQPYRTDDNKIEGVVLALHDIDAVKRSERYLQTIIEKVPTPLLVLDADLKVKLANETFCETFKVNRGDTIGQMLYRLGNEQWNIPALTELLQTFLPQHKLVKNFSVTHDFPEIGWKTVLVSGRRIEEAFSRQGDPLILLTIEDITERKQAEIALARLAAIVEYSDDAIISKNLDGVIQTWNRGAEKLFGYTEEEAVGQPITMLMPSDRVHEEAAILKRLRSGEHIHHYESVRRRKDGSLLDVSLTISPIVDEHGQIVGASKFARDISDRKLTEAALIKSEKLATAGRLAATLAHEINNPLQAVANLVSIWAQSPGLDAQGQACAAMAENELRRVTHLTQQSLSFYREAASPLPVNVEETIDSVLSIYDKRIEAKGIRVTKQYQLNGTTIRTYPGELRQVFSTLLVNAMEAVDAGGTIAVRARKASHWQNQAIRGVRVTISDSGVGIPASNIHRIFEPFFTTKGENGTGLGLWVASGIVNRFGGSILTRSSVHPDRHGTCFSIFLPTKP
jgi:two-component system CheB/CheR fusion protein